MPAKNKANVHLLIISSAKCARVSDEDVLKVVDFDGRYLYVKFNKKNYPKRKAKVVL